MSSAWKSSTRLTVWRILGRWNTQSRARTGGSACRERDKTFYESKCATLDRQIDNLVYELYDLTPEEIAIVEGQSK
jgi:hypothetical protein